jgi:hypothetical protein
MIKMWVINAYGWGAFLFEGTEFEAEEVRINKAKWEQTITKKRLATKNELKNKNIDDCKNHPGFKLKGRYSCDCKKCEKYNND